MTEKPRKIFSFLLTDLFFNKLSNLRSNKDKHSTHESVPETCFRWRSLVPFLSIAPASLIIDEKQLKVSENVLLFLWPFIAFRIRMFLSFSSVINTTMPHSTNVPTDVSTKRVSSPLSTQFREAIVELSWNLVLMRKLSNGNDEKLMNGSACFVYVESDFLCFPTSVDYISQANCCEKERRMVRRAESRRQENLGKSNTRIIIELVKSVNFALVDLARSLMRFDRFLMRGRWELIWAGKQTSFDVAFGRVQKFIRVIFTTELFGPLNSIIINPTELFPRISFTNPSLNHRQPIATQHEFTIYSLIMITISRTIIELSADSCLNCFCNFHTAWGYQLLLNLNAVRIYRMHEIISADYSES